MKLRILIIEDDSGVRETLSDLLESLGYLVYTAFNGQDGMNQLQKLTPDLIICDVMMPVMDGMEFLRIVKSNRDLWMIPVLMLTAKVEFEDRMKAYEIGADGYLVKPFEVKSLAYSIKNLIALSQNISSKGANGKGPLAVHTFLVNLNNAIELHLTDSSLELIAKEMNLSESSLQKKIKYYTKHNFSEYLRRYKLSRAKALLQAGMCNVTESSIRSGFKNLAHFSESFKALYGLSPSKVLAEV